MVKFSHSVFALPFAMMAAFLAGRHLIPDHHPGWLHLLLVTVCMVGARSVAMTFNRIVDAGIDARNVRTAGRPLPSGALSGRVAYVYLGVASAVFVGGCWGFDSLFGNPWPWRLSLPVLLFLCGYSYTKRFTKWSHFYLGIAIGLSPLAAWIAVHPASVGWPAVILSAAVTLWIAGFDIIYACQDIDVDRREGLFSLPSRWGPRGALMVTRMCHALVIVLLLVLAAVAPMGWVFQLGVGGVAVLLIVENGLVRAGDYSRVNLAFFTINGVVSLGLGVLAILDVLFVSTIP